MIWRGRDSIDVAAEAANASISLFRRFTREPPSHTRDSWQPLQLAAISSLFLRSLARFRSLDGYTPSGFRSQDVQFSDHEAAIVMRFEYHESPHTLAEARQRENAQRSSRQFGRFHPIYAHDISILYAFAASDASAETTIATLERFIAERIEAAAGALVVSVDEVFALRDVYRERPSRIYRLCWQSLTFALSHRLCARLQVELREQLVCAFCDRPLTLA